MIQGVGLPPTVTNHSTMTLVPEGGARWGWGMRGAGQSAWWICPWLLPQNWSQVLSCRAQPCGVNPEKGPCVYVSVCLCSLMFYESQLWFPKKQILIALSEERQNSLFILSLDHDMPKLLSSEEASKSMQPKKPREKMLKTGASQLILFFFFLSPFFFWVMWCLWCCQLLKYVIYYDLFSIWNKYLILCLILYSQFWGFFS